MNRYSCDCLPLAILLSLSACGERDPQHRTSTATSGVATERAAEGEASEAPDQIVNTLGMTLVRIPAGSFAMGSAPGEPERRVNEGPKHEVQISRPFYLGAHEVTIENFRAFAERSGYLTEAERDAGGGFGIDFSTGTVQQDPTITWRQPGFPGFDQGNDHPVILISWEDAEAFCQWLSEEESRRYRLPTEAEWEYAARAATTSRYWFGDEPPRLAATANTADASLREAMPAATWCAEWSDGYPFTAPVGRFAPNPWGLYDMHGNVWEWCSDWYGDDFYQRSPEVDPRGPDSGRFRTIRGGGWFNGAGQQRAAQRVYFAPTFRYCLLSGFRVVLEIDERRSDVRGRHE